jgi:hypothetical protein
MDLMGLPFVGVALHLPSQGLIGHALRRVRTRPSPSYALGARRSWVRFTIGLLPSRAVT